MAGRAGSSGYYRRRSYKNRKWRKVVVIAAICLAVLLLLFIIIGNILGDKAEQTKTDRNDREESSSSTADIKTSYSIKGYSVKVDNITLSELSKQLSECSEIGAFAISLRLTDSDGHPIYRSDIAKSFGYGEQNDNMLSLANVMSRLKSNGMTASACVNVTSNVEKDAKVSTVISAYEAALIAEIVESGITDVLICPSELSTEHISMLVRLAENVKEINENAVLGLSVPTEILSSSDGEMVVNTIMKSFDFFAFDLTSEDEENIADKMASKVSDNLYYILRYNARVLLPEQEDTELRDDIIEIMNENNINNWQFVS